jgi:high affinity Mn2+ porin
MIFFRKPVSTFRDHALTANLAAAACLVAALGGSFAPAMAADMPLKAPAALPSFDWTGFYVGGHFGYAGGTSNWTETSVGTPGQSASGSFDLFQPFGPFDEAGSYFAGVQAGYNRMLPNRVVLGVEGDVSFPGFPPLSGITIGGASTFATPTLGLETYSETVVHSGTLRGRIGYAPGTWLFYATAGFAWTYDSLTLTQLANGTMESAFHWRLGWAAGAGVEAPVAPHWTMKVEYLFTDYGTSGVRGTEQPAGERPRPRELRPDALCRTAPVAGRGIMVQPGDRSGIWFR